MISHRINRDQNDAAKHMLSNLQQYLASRGHRADLSLATKAKCTEGSFSATVKFDTALGYPEETDLLAVVAQYYPDHEINWDLAEVDTDLGVVLLQLEPSREVIPIESLDKIPPEFKPIGSGIYKRAADATGTVQEIWTLSKGQDGLMLYRNMDDLEVTAEDENQFRAGDIVNTPYGPGRIQRFDEVGNAIVTVGNQKKLVAAGDLIPYNINKEKKMLEEYFAQAYGDKTLADALVKDYSTRGKKK
jgi:hypothetical protein